MARTRACRLKQRYVESNNVGSKNEKYRTYFMQPHLEIIRPYLISAGTHARQARAGRVGEEGEKGGSRGEVEVETPWNKETSLR